MLSRSKLAVRYFSCTRKSLYALDKSKLGDLSKSLKSLENSEFDHSEFKDLITHHHTRLNNNIDEAEKEYTNIYNLAASLTKALDTSPLVSLDDKREIMNLLIEKFAKYNYAASNLAFKTLGNNKENLTLHSAVELVTHNPGRVTSSHDLYKKLQPEDQVPHDLLIAATIKKLLFGDAVEIKEGLEKVNLEKLESIVSLFNKIGDKSQIDDETFTKFVNVLVDLECTRLITKIQVPSHILESVIMEQDLKGSDYLYMFETSINNGTSLSGNSLLKILMPISSLQLKNVKESDNLKELRQKLNITFDELAPVSEITDEIREQIQELALDDSFKVRLDLIKSSGFHSKDIEKAIYFFQKYQSLIPEGTQEQYNLKSTISLVTVYDCINKDDDKLLRLAESLVPQSPVPAAQNLASFVLYHGWSGDSDKSLYVYNKSLDIYLEPREGNESNRGMLVYSLAAVSLLGKEIGLAQVVKKKSMENELINDEWEARLTNLLKDYGDIVEACAEDEGKFRKEMKTIFLNALITFSP
ncbi:hypothetical protein DAMA08_009700 [Martiniozyma asiatica (nom. inval.)]|nr:hypothetical protein DAMA08_009700 [Martiniozyma asiatica]